MTSEFWLKKWINEPPPDQDHGGIYILVTRTTYLHIRTAYGSQRALEGLQPVHSAHDRTHAATACKLNPPSTLWQCIRLSSSTTARLYSSDK